ncbi:MAG: hypothetical protein ACFFBV_07995 [Promethearchaeota archaeon]
MSVRATGLHSAEEDNRMGREKEFNFLVGLIHKLAIDKKILSSGWPIIEIIHNKPLLSVDVDPTDYTVVGSNLYFYRTLEDIVFQNVGEWISYSYIPDYYNALDYNIHIYFSTLIPNGIPPSISYEEGPAESWAITHLGEYPPTPYTPTKPLEIINTTADELSRIALAQASSYAISDYFNQYWMAAEDGQNKASLDYTILVTFWSTLISNLILVPITAGIYFKSPFFSTASQMTYSRLLGISALSITKSILSEIYEELYVDPVIENWIAAWFYEAGWDSEAAEFWSMIVTSFREAFFGAASDLIKGAIKGVRGPKIDININIDTLIQQKVKLENTQVLKSLVIKGALVGIGLTAASCIFGGSNLGVLTAALGVATDVAIDKLQTKYQIEMLDQKIGEMVGEITKVRPDLAADITWVLNSPTVRIVPLLTNPLTTSASQVASQSISSLSTLGVTEHYIQEVMDMVNSQPNFNEFSHEITLTDYGKMLIEQYGFAPMGGLKLPDGRNTWELGKLKPIEDMNLAEYQAFLKSISSKYAETVEILKIEDKESYKVKDRQSLEKLINSINEERLTNGESGVWGVVYKITDPRTGFKRIGKTEDNTDFLFIDRLKSYIRKAQKISQPNVRLNAFEVNLADYFGFSQGENLELEPKSFIDDFFTGYDVEIWLCDDQVELFALEVLITLYTNRISNEVGFDLRKNNLFNKVVGPLMYNLEKIKAYNLDKLESILTKCFDRALTRELAFKRFVDEGIRVRSESIFDKYCEIIKGTTYYNAMNKHIIEEASISSDLDVRTASWLKDKFSREKLSTLLWTVEGPDGNIKPLFLGFHLSDDSGSGFLHSFLEHRSKFAKWFIRADNRQPLVSCRMVSELVYNAIKYNDFTPLGNNRYKYNFIYNLKPISFIIELNSITGEIEKIEPQ